MDSAIQRLNILGATDNRAHPNKKWSINKFVSLAFFYNQLR